MADPMIDTLIREVLAEELARVRAKSGDGTTSAPGAAPAREERVTVASDADLQSLVQRVLTMTDNPSERAGLVEGKIVFRLNGGPGESAAAVPAGGRQTAGGHTERIEHGLLSERLVDRLSPRTRTVLLGRQVRTTPLARDRLRQRGISIERME